MSDVLYITLNIALAVAALVIIRFGQSPWLAVALVLLGKWRALAVKPRFWFANLVANMVDMIVGIGVVALLYAAGSELVPQVIVTILYIIWLLFIKPKSKKRMITLQAGIAVFVGMTALATVSYSWDSFFVVLLAWLIGYSAARHVLGNYEEPMTSIYSLVMGFIFAEITWIGYHWMFAYSIPGAGGIKLPQLAIIGTTASFVAERAYVSYHRNGKVRSQDILLPILLLVAITTVLLLFFNKIALNSSL